MLIWPICAGRTSADQSVFRSGTKHGFVFRDGRSIAIIDFDNAAPGARSDDLGYALFLWLNLGTDGPVGAENSVGGLSPQASPSALFG